MSSGDVSKERVLDLLKRYSIEDLDPHSGKLFSHVYATGLRELEKIAREAYMMYMDKTMLNFTVYPSILRMENEIVSITKKWLHGDEEVVGNFTYGGTESIFLAVKTARDYHIDNGREKPEIILPATAHPAFYKSAHYLGIKVVQIPIDKNTLKADVEKLKEKISERTCMIVGSAPNYPYGVIDDIEEIADIAREKDVWFHVDACIGGYLLPFLKELGEDIPKFDFEVDGVTSISTDLHKYGYTPKGASVILYRSRRLRLYQLYINASWPGYPLVNTTVLSTRSAGPLAAAWAVLNYLGEEGYLKLAKKILDVKKKLLRRLPELGYRIMGEPQSSIVTFTSKDINIFLLADYMKKKGWYIQAQPGSRHLGFPPSIHLTLSPIHHKVIDEFLEELKDATEKVREMPEPPARQIAEMLGGGSTGLEEIDVSSIMDMLGISRGISGDMALINMLMHEMPPNMVEYLFKHVVNELFTKD